MKCQCGNRDLRYRAGWVNNAGCSVRTFECLDCGRKGTKIESDRGIQLKGCLR